MTERVEQEHHEHHSMEDGCEELIRDARADVRPRHWVERKLRERTAVLPSSMSDVHFKESIMKTRSQCAQEPKPQDPAPKPGPTPKPDPVPKATADE